MNRTKRLTQTERAEIIREAGEGVGTSVLAERFGVTPRAIQYTLKADEERQKDAAVATAAVTVKLTPEELGALDEVLAAAGIDYPALRAAPTAQVIERLTAVPGIGVWTAEIYAMFSLGRADVFAPGDIIIEGR